MSFFDKLGEYLYGNFSTEYADNAATHQEVAAGQSDRYNQLVAEGKLDPVSNLIYQQDIKAAGDITAEARAKDSSLANLLSGVPWWIWAALVAAGFWWLGGFTALARSSKGILK